MRSLGYMLLAFTLLFNVHCERDNVQSAVNYNLVDESYIQAQSALFSVEIKGKYGYVTCSGDVVIPATYTIAHEFQEGLAAVRIEDAWGYIDTSGNLVIPAVYEQAFDFSEGLAFVFKKNGSKRGVIDHNGKWVIEPKFSIGIRFSEGVAIIDDYPTPRMYIDRSGKPVIQKTDLYTPGGDFHEGLAVFEKDGKVGFIDKFGQIRIPAQYDDSRGIFSEGVVAVRTGSKVKFIDVQGQDAFPGTYDHAEWFSEGLAAVIKDEYWGFIDKKGELVIPAKFMMVSAFKNGISFAYLPDGKVGCINRQGVFLAGPFEFDR